MINMGARDQLENRIDQLIGSHPVLKIHWSKNDLSYTYRTPEYTLYIID